MTKKEFNRLYSLMDPSIKALVHTANIINRDEFLEQYVLVHREIHREDFLLVHEADFKEYLVTA